jgi:Rrf2 family protein
MQITRETDYAIRCVHFLSSRHDRTLIVDRIAEQMCIPKTFLAKILQKLVKAGIVKSFRGAKGGCQLTRGPEDITLLDVIEAIQGPVAMNACALDSSVCGLSSKCSVHPVWIEVRKEVEAILRKKNFAEFLKS